MAEQLQVKSEAYIKPEPEGDSPNAPLDEDDLYEDAGDLEFFDQNSGNGSVGQAYLARLPKELWEAWSSLPDDAEIEVGKMRQWDVARPDGSVEHRFRMLLNKDVAGHQGLPREYDLDMGLDNARGTFMFTEEDLPNFKAKSKLRTDASNNGIPAHLLRPKSERFAKPARKPFDRKARYQPFYRKAIPKRTKIAARLMYELACRPVDNDESRSILQLKQIQAHKPKHELKIVDHWQMNGVIAQGSAAAMTKFGGFVKTTNPVKTSKQKKPANKATRMEENELRTALLDAFTTKYQYWKMSVLKATFNQPEAYLRQELEKVAILNRSGPHSNEWELKPELKQIINNRALDESAPDAVDDDDDEVDMEDVLPGSG